MLTCSWSILRTTIDCSNTARIGSILLMMSSRLFPFAFAVLLSVALHAADWPQWQGPDRTRVSKETGLQKEWVIARCCPVHQVR